MKKQSVLLEYILKNKKNFLIIIGVFFIGMILGVLFINHASSSQIEEIQQYVSKLVGNIKSYEEIDKTEILVQSITQNVLCILLIWLLGCTIIGSVFIILAVLYRGFSLGYTISAMIASLGIKTGSVFAVSALLVQNIIFLPAFFILSESGIKLYKGIYKNHINLKFEVIRHSIVMLIALVLSIISSFAEVYISTNLIIFLKDFL
jgi:stage II sporulation protein M